MSRVFKTATTIIALTSLFFLISALAQSANSQAANQSVGSIGIQLQIGNQPPAQVSKVVVESVIEDGPAGKAGLKAGDIITTVDGRAVGSVAEFAIMTTAHAIGSTVTIGYVRNGQQLNTSVTVVERNKLYITWLTKGSEQGDQRAQLQLARAFMVGDFGLAKNEAQAVYWLRKAADQGNAMAQNGLGILYRDAKGVPQDYSKAVYWFRKAADQDNPDGQTNLGVMYQLGWGVKQNYAEAVRWYRKAANQGHALGENNLGTMYQNGRGVAQDYAEAVRWYRKAVDQRNAFAQANLGLMYENGDGLPQDRSLALYWYNKAAEQGNEDAQKAAERLKAAGVEPRTSETNEGESSVAKTQPKLASIVVVTNIPGANVAVDGKQQGVTGSDGRLTIKDLAAGEHELQLSQTGYNSVSHRVSLGTGDTATVELKISRIGPPPLTFEDVLGLLNGGVTPNRTATLVRERGVDFALSAEAKQQVLSAGGNDTLLLAIVESGKAKPTPMTPESKTDEKEAKVKNEQLRADLLLDGAWAATIADGKGSAVVQFNLIQSSDGDVVGTYTSSLGGGGQIKGSIKNSQFAFELKQSLQNCPGIFKGTATIDGGKAVGTYTGTDCLGDHGKGTLTMNKGGGQPEPVKSQPGVQITDGKPEELRGVKKIAVLAANNLRARNEVAQVLRDNGLEVVEPQHGELGLMLEIKYTSQGELIVADVKGQAVKPTQSSGVHRVWSYSKKVMKRSVKEQDLAKAFVKEFLNVYRRENQ
jgi:TPR repeat protein